MPISTIDTPESVKLDRANIEGVRFAYDGKQVSVREFARNGTTVMYTVPAGHMFLMFGWACSVFYTATTTTTGEMVISTDGISNHYNTIISRGGKTGEDHHDSGSMIPPFVIPAGGLIRITSASTPVEVTASMYGIVIKI